MGETREQKVIRQLSGVQTTHKVTPIATGMILPNHSGTHDAGILLKTPTKDTDLVNKKYVDDELSGISVFDLSDFPADPNADKFLKWNDTTNALEWADAGGGGSDTWADVMARGNVIADDVKALFGASSSASIYYDQTNLVINPKEAGAGVLDVRGEILSNENDITIGKGSQGSPPISYAQLNLDASKSVFIRADGNQTTDFVGMLMYGATEALKWGYVNSILGLYAGTDLHTEDRIYLGDSDASSIYYDTTNLVINPKEVGTGYVDVKGDILAEVVKTNRISRNDPLQADFYYLEYEPTGLTPHLHLGTAGGFPIKLFTNNADTTPALEINDVNSLVTLISTTINGDFLVKPDGTNAVIQTAGYALYGSSYYKTLDWDACSLYENNSDNYLSIDWEDRILYSNDGTSVAINWDDATSLKFYISNTNQFNLIDGAIEPATDEDIDLGSSTYWLKDIYIKGDIYYGDTGSYIHFDGTNLEIVDDTEVKINAPKTTISDGTRIANIADGTNAGTFTDGTKNCNLCTGTYGVDSDDIHASASFWCNSTQGYTGDLNDSTSTKIADVVGGIITVVYY